MTTTASADPSPAAVPPRFVRCDVGDVRPLLELLHQEGWYDRTAPELDFVLTVSRRSCFKIIVGDDLVGLLLSTITPGRIGYLSGFLIDSKRRGTLDVMDGVLKFEQLLEKLSAVQIGYADQRILPFYLDYGYQAHEVYSRYAVRPHAARARRWELQPLQDFDLAEVYMLNDQAYHDTRDALLRHFRAVPSVQTLVARTASGVFGDWAMMRRTRIGAVVGPCVAQGPEAAAALVSALRAEVPAEQPVLLAGQVDRTDAWLRQAGIPFERQKFVSTKVCKGDASKLENPAPIFGLFGFGLT